MFSLLFSEKKAVSLYCLFCKNCLDSFLRLIRSCAKVRQQEPLWRNRNTHGGQSWLFRQIERSKRFRGGSGMLIRTLFTSAFANCLRWGQSSGERPVGSRSSIPITWNRLQAVRVGVAVGRIQVIAVADSFWVGAAQLQGRRETTAFSLLSLSRVSGKKR